MSAKNLDKHNRWRSRQVAFRLSPEEADLLDTYVKLSGLTKQDYITRRLLIEVGAAPDDELLDVIRFLSKIMEGMKEDTDGR